MKPLILSTDEQSRCITQPLNKKIWLEGIASAGKTTAAVKRLLYLLTQGVPAESILVYVPQRTLAQPYLRALRQDKQHQGGQAAVHTIGSLTLQIVETFWFLISTEAGFKHPHDLPNFLSLELVQYFMARAIAPLVDERDYFSSVRINRARLYSQIVDNMNKAAVVGFPIEKIAARLKSALGGSVEQEHIYDDAQSCALAFRKYCLEHNLLDFSLQVDVFFKHLWTKPQPRRHLQRRVKHLIADNIEEDNPASHRLLRDLLQTCDSALILYDADAGFRRFLGADKDNARHLRDYCDVQAVFTESFAMTNKINALGLNLAARLDQEESASDGAGLPSLSAPAFITETHDYHPQMISWVVERIDSLVNQQGVSGGEIVVLAPYLSDALRFGLVEGLQARGIQARSHRPSRALRDEPAARALLTFARLAHPHWGILPTEFDVAFALMTAIGGLDLIRAKLLTEIAYHQGRLHPFANIVTAMQHRITYEFGERYDLLLGWLDDYIEGESLEAIDLFFRRIFGEILSQEGFSFHRNDDASGASMNLVDSARRFRWALDFMQGHGEDIDIGRDYVQMVEQGVIANFYLRDWVMDTEDSVLIAPAYTFLLNNRAVDVQFWLNIGSEGWSRRLYQPLTHPYVLSLGWQPGRAWGDEDEQMMNRQVLGRLILGLTRRCRQEIYLGYSELSESGYEPRGLLLDAIQGLLRQMAREERHV